MGADNNFLGYAEACQLAGKDSPARKRIVSLFDEGSFVELDAFVQAGILTGYGTVDGNPVFAFAQNTEDHCGAVGRLQGKKLAKLYDLALKAGGPVVGIYDSLGGDIANGNDTLAAYGEMLAAANNLSGVVPQVSLVLGVCGGTAAMMACGADFVVMSQKAQLFLTAPFTAKANGEKVEAGTANAAMKAGVAHLVKETEEDAIDAVRLLVSMLPINNISDIPAFEYAEPTANPSVAASAQELATAIADPGSVLALQEGFGMASATVLSTLGGRTCGIVATNGQALDKDDCAKISRFVNVCDAFRIPVLTLLNTCGFKQSAADDIAGGIREMAKVAHIYAEATTAKVCVVTGEATGSAYIALAGKGSNADVVYAWPEAVISAMAPEAAVALLYSDEISGGKSREQVVSEFKATEGSAIQAACQGYIEAIVEPAQTRRAVLNVLDILSGKRVSRLPKKHSNMPL